MSLDFTNLKDEYSSTAKPLKFNFLNSLDLTNSVKSKLTLNLNRVVSGISDVFLTPIGRDYLPDVLLDELDSLLSNKQHLISENLYNLEQSNRSKFGPRSLAKPWVDRKDSLYDYFENRNDKSIVQVPNLRPTLRPLSIKEASRYLKNNTSSGLPFYTNKGSIKDNVVDNFSDLLNREDPCVLFTRTQEGGKTRNVWGYPIVDTLNEMRFYQPLLHYQNKLEYRKALLGPNQVDLAITNMMKGLNKSEYSLLSIDFSSYDASIGDNLQKNCFDYIKRLFQNEYRDDIDYIQYRFNTIGIICPDGILKGSHGVPSGATFTNEVDSLAQYLLVSSSSIDCSYQIQGDDGAYVINDKDINRLFELFNTSGLTVNKSKSYVSKDYLIYLQKLYDFKYLKNGFIGGIYPLYRALDRIIYQERYSNFMDYSLNGKDYYSLRTISILENCKYHPLFKEFVKFIYTKDKYKLKFSTDGVKNYDRMINNGPGSVGFLNNQYGDNVKGINNFETVKIIRELS